MQRPGVLIAVTAAASDARTTNLEGITRAYAPILRRQVAVPEDARDNVLRYVREQRLWKRYASLQQADALPPEATVDVQDLWLSDPIVPAATGAITTEVVHEPPQLASSVRLVRENNFTRTDRGRALLALLSDAERSATQPGGALNESTVNLFQLSLGVRGFLTYAFFDADFDFLRAAYTAAPLAYDDFTRAEFADRLNEACRILRKQWTRQARSGSDRRLLARLDEWAKQIDKPRRSGKEWGGGRPPDQLATLRLEPYVDFGLIHRRSRTTYRYRLDPAQRTFFDELANQENSDEFLNRELFGNFLAALGHEAERISDDAIWKRVAAAYDRLKSALGFASFQEVALLAIGQLLNEDRTKYFEVGDGLDVIRERQKAEPRLIRFGAKRGGGLTYMKIAEGHEGR